MGNYILGKINREELPSDEIYRGKILSVKTSRLFYNNLENHCDKQTFSPTIEQLEKKYQLTYSLFLEMLKSKLAYYGWSDNYGFRHVKEGTQNSKCMYFYKREDKDVFAEIFKKEFFEEQEKEKINSIRHRQQLKKEFVEKDKFSESYEKLTKKFSEILKE